MRRLLCLFLVLLFLPVVSLASSASPDYEPSLKMNMSTFVTKYNALGSSLSSSLLPLEKPFQWSTYDKYRVAWFNTDKKSGVKILLLSADPKAGVGLEAGIDVIQIYMEKPADFLSFVTIAVRCSQLFSSELFGSSLAPLAVADIMSYYYENSTGSYYAYRSLDSENIYALMFFMDHDSYYFEICPRGDL